LLKKPRGSNPGGRKISCRMGQGVMHGGVGLEVAKKQIVGTEKMGGKLLSDGDDVEGRRVGWTVAE